MNVRTLTPANLAWRQTLPALAAVLAIVLLLYRDTAAAMVQIWARSETFAHGFVVLPITVWLVWRQREALARMAPQPSAWMLVPVAAAGALWLLGDLAAAHSATQLALVSLLVSCVIAMLGRRAAGVIAFPLAFLFFAVPIGEFMMPRLMAWTGDVTALALRMSGLPVYREGLQLVIPTGTWSVVEACSGIRYLIASFMVGTLYAYLHYRSLRRRLLFIGMSLAVPIVANWIRAYLIVLTGHLSNNRLATGADHLLYGWLFFGIVIGLMFLIGARWSEAHVDAPPQKFAAPDARTGPAARWAVVGTLAILAVAPQWAANRVAGVADGAAVVLAEVPGLHPRWQDAGPPPPGWRPAYAGAAAESRRAYVAAPAAERVGVYVAYYRGQHYGRKMLTSENVLVKSDDAEWIVAARGRRPVDATGTPAVVRTVELRSRTVWKGERRITVWQAYWINGTWVEDDLGATIQGVLQRLLGGGDDAAVVVLHVDGSGSRADDLLQMFVKDNLGSLQAQLRSTRDGDWVSRQTMRGKGMP